MIKIYMKQIIILIVKYGIIMELIMELIIRVDMQLKLKKMHIMMYVYEEFEIGLVVIH